MNRPLVVITSTGLATTLKWWNTMKVDGHALVLASDLSGHGDDVDLAIAQLGSEEEAQAMFRAVRMCLRLGIRRFNALHHSQVTAMMGGDV